MSTCAFANAVLWKTRIYAKVSKCGIWKRRCTYYALGILLLLIFQVMISNTGHWGVMKLCFPEKENLVSPSQWFHIVQLPFHLTPLFPPAPLYIRLLTNCSVTATDSKVFEAHTQIPEDLLQAPSLLFSISIQHFQGEISVLICCSV